MEVADVLQSAVSVLAPPPDLTVSEWADEYRRVSIGPFPGKWKTDRTPDLREPMDCAADPLVEGIVIVKPTRIGGTDGPINNPIGYYVHYDPCDILYAQSSKDQGELYSDSIFMPMFRDTPVLAEKMVKELGRKATQTKTKKYFIGGATMRIIGAKSPKGFQAIQARLAIGDDLDEWEISKTGDPVQKLIDRTKGIWNRKIILVSFPTRKETSRIWDYYQRTDQRQWYVPCPHCDEYQVLKFGERDTDYGLKWEGKTGAVWYVCEHCHGRIEEYSKDKMSARGEWRAEAEFNGWAGFKLNPFTRSWHRWTEIRDTFLQAGTDPFKLMVFVNQTLGEVWEDKSDARVTEEELYARREIYPADVPRGASILTAAVDTQDNRLECKVMGWGPGEEGWVIEHKAFMGSPVEEAVWNALDNYLLQTFRHESGYLMEIKSVCIDTGGHHTAQVYTFTGPRYGRGIIAVHGSNDPKSDVLDGPVRTNKGSGAKYRRVGASTCKDILDGRLRLRRPGHGYIHFPNALDMEYFRQLLGEQVTVTKSGKRQWTPIPGRRNEAMDLYNYNLAALRILRPDWEAISRGVGEDRGLKVYRNYRQEIHLADVELKEQYPIVLCCDFKKDAMIWELAQTDGKEVWVFDEIYIRNSDTVEMAMKVQRKYGGHRRGIIVYGSAQGTIRSYGGKSEYALLSDYGMGRKKVKRTDPPREDIINAVNNMLENLEGRSRLTIGNDCIMLRRDLEQCLWLEDRSDIDRTDFGRGNAAEALGYFINYEWPLRAKSATPHRRFYK